MPDAERRVIQRFYPMTCAKLGSTGVSPGIRLAGSGRAWAMQKFLGLSSDQGRYGSKQVKRHLCRVILSRGFGPLWFV